MWNSMVLWLTGLFGTVAVTVKGEVVEAVEEIVEEVTEDVEEALEGFTGKSKDEAGSVKRV